MSKKNSKNFITDAIKSIAKAQIEMAEELEKHDKILESHSKEIAELQAKVTDMRNNAIVAELRYTPGKEVAERYNLSPSRVSQIKKEFNN